MLILLILALPAAVAIVALAPRFLPRRAVVASGLVIAAIGAATVAYVEWRYAPDNTLPVRMPVALDRAVIIRTPAFRVAVSGPYDLWLEFDRKQEGEDFACLTGDAGAEAVCPRRDPDLAVAWTVTADAAPVARGATDWSGWHRKQAALDPAEAARRQKAYRAYQARLLDPSNNWPRYYKLGAFTAEAGHAYIAALDVQKPAGALAALHPRLAIGLGGEATKGLGTMALIFCILCIVTGGALLLRVIPRGQGTATP